MRMLRRMLGVTRSDRISNARIRGTAKVGEISGKIQEARLRWYGHAIRGGEGMLEERIMNMRVDG